MTSNTAPKVGDAIKTYEDLKALPDGTALALNWADRVRRFVQHDGDTVNLFDKDGVLRNSASPEKPALGAVFYVVRSIPETDPNDADIEDIFGDTYEPPEPEPEPEWRVGQTVNTYEDLRRLPEGTVITRDADGRRRTIETRGGVLGAWDHEGGIMLLGESGGDSFAGATPKYTIARLPVATEASDPADDLADFKRQVVEVATRLAKEHGLCNEVDKALEELGLPIRNREHTVTMTVTVQIDLGPDSDPREWDNERIAEYGRTVVEDALENTGATVTDATTTTPTADRSK